MGRSMRCRPNYYRLLHVQPDAPIEVIRASFHTLMRELRQHPDLGGSNSGAALLNEAYTIVGNPILRATYDREQSVRSLNKECSANIEHGRGLAAISCPFCRKPQARTSYAFALCPICASPLQPDNEADSDRECRRAMARIRRNDMVHYRSRSSHDVQAARMVDLSPGGMRLLCHEELVVGAVLKIRGPDLNASASVTNHHGEVVDGQKLHSVGISFLAIEFNNPSGSFLSTEA